MESIWIEWRIMAIRKFSTAEPGVKSNKFWDQDTTRGVVTPIASRTINADENNFVFSSIPQSFQDLRVVLTLRSADTSGSSVLYSIYMNGLGASGASRTTLQGQGTTASSYRHTTSSPTYGFQGFEAGDAAPNGIFGTSILDILSYSDTTKFKTGISRVHSNTSTAGLIELTVTTYSTTAAVSSLMFSGTQNFRAGTTVTLYGIKAGV